MSEDRQAIVNWARHTISHGSKSFGLASRLLPRDERENAWLLYAWCRTCDDVTDGQVLGFSTADAACDEAPDLWNATSSAVLTDLPAPKPFSALRLVQKSVELPIEYVEDHLRGFDLDRANWRPQQTEDLLGYCYHVAGAVGGLMAAIMGVARDDKDTHNRAMDLGIAFQLSNIARDIIEDALAGRCYIPADWLRAEGMSEATLADPKHRKQVAEFARLLVGMADQYEQSAKIGAKRLSLRCRLAIFAAANVYGKIGRKVVSKGARAWDQRTTTSALEKLGAVATAFAQANSSVPERDRQGLFNREQWRSANPDLFKARLTISA